MARLTTLSIQDETREPARSGGGALVTLLVILLFAAVGFTGYRILQRIEAVERRVDGLSVKLDEATALARKATGAGTAEAAVAAASTERQSEESQTADPRHQADKARQEATTTRETAARTQADADRIRKKAEAEIDRLDEALGRIAETRRTALGLVVNLGGDHLKFEPDKAELSQGDRELLSRIVAILKSSHSYTISVNGHTDEVGTDAHNQRLSERRAQAVRAYLVTAGLPAGILSVQGHGKTFPLVAGTSDAARAKNRRVELGIVNTQIRDGR